MGIGRARSAAGSLSLLALLLASGCASVVFVRAPGARTYSGSSYSSSRGAFFMGLLGPDHDLSADQICLGKDIDQVTMKYSPTDVIETVLTVGIYAPRTVEVWCAL